MHTITAKEIETLISKKEVNFYNFYNTDIDNAIYLASQHYQNNVESDTDQFIHTIFLDIEVYQENRAIKFEFDKSDHPINSITFYDNKSGEFHSYFLVRPFIQSKLKSLESTTQEYSQWLVDNKYFKDISEIKLNLNYGQGGDEKNEFRKYIKE